VYCALRSAVLAVSCIFLLCGVTAYADTHWANIAGSDIPPYTNYASGAHQIQDVIDEAVAGDTIRIAAGLYNPDTTIFLKDSLTILGVGRDSTIIDPQLSQYTSYTKPIMYLHGASGEAGGELIISDCAFRDRLADTNEYAARNGIKIFFQATGMVLISDNLFENLNGAVRIYDTPAIIRNNIITCRGNGISLGFMGPYEVADNHIIGTGSAERSDIDVGIAEMVFILGPVTISNNTIVIPSGFPILLEMDDDSIFIYNNLLVSSIYDAISLYCHYGGAVIRNNTFIRNGVHRLSTWNRTSAVFAVGGFASMVIENNAFQSLNNRVDFLESDNIPDGGSFAIYNNNFWRTDSGSSDTLLFDYRVSIDTSDNIRKPMFVDDSLFYLQRGSPLIDAGNPAHSDLNLTCSDIGWTGGVGGILYDYPELPPDAPDTLIGTNDGDSLHFVWSMNQEADLAIYRVYKDSSSDIFFKITALDTAGPKADRRTRLRPSQRAFLREMCKAIIRFPEHLH